MSWQRSIEETGTNYWWTSRL